MTHIQQRRDQSGIWAGVNPVLYDGEAGHEEDTGRWKLGDGVTAWNGLPYKSGVDSVSGKTGVVVLDVDDVAGAAPLASPALTGTPTTPTAPTPTDSTRIASTAFVKAAIAQAFTDAGIAGMIADAVAAAKLEMHPVKSLYFNTENVNPGTFLGGTWIAWGSGRVPVGVGGATDFATPEQEGGVKDVILTGAQSGLKGHGHGVSDPGHGHVYLRSNPIYHGLTEGGSTITVFSAPAEYDANVSTSVTGVTVNAVTDTNAAEAHTNLQPYITCYMFKRTA